MKNYSIKAKIVVDKNDVDFKSNIIGIANNAIANQFEFFHENLVVSIAYDELISRFQSTLKAGFSFIVHAKIKNHFFKIAIEFSQITASIEIIPLGPYQIKHVLDNGEELLDLGFYVECLIELCENFAVVEISTEEIVKR